MTAQLLTSLDQLWSLYGEWTSLWRRDPYASPFQSPQWLLPWWKHIGRGEIFSVAVRTGDTLAALLPMYILAEPTSGLRKLLPLGIATTDYLDGIFATAHRQLALAAAMDCFCRRGDAWDRFEFPQLRPCSPLFNGQLPADLCPILSLPDTFHELLSRLPYNLAHNLNYYRRRAARFGGVSFDSVTTGNVEEFTDALLTLHTARWNADDAPGVLATDRVRASHREAIPELLQLGALRMFALRVDGNIAAIWYGLVDHPHVQREQRAYYYYLGGFDPACSALSPGTLLIAHAIETAIRERVRNFDFLRGREAYKYHWGARDTPTYRLVFTSPGKEEPWMRPLASAGPSAM